MTQESQVFRPTKKHWINTALNILFVVILLSITGFVVWYFSDHFPNCFFVLAPIILLLGGLVGLATLWLRLRTNLQFTESMLIGHTGWKAFNYLWDEIVFITEFEDTDNKGKTPYLVIATQDSGKEFDLTGFDKTAVWQAIEIYAPSEILKPDAYKDLAQYQLYKQEVNDKLNSITLPISINVSKGWQLFFCAVFLFMGSMAYLSYTSNFLLVITVLILCMTLWALYASIHSLGTLTTDTDKIIVSRPWATYQILWSEVQYVQIGPQSEECRLVFYGNDKRLGFPAPNLWNKSKKEDFTLFMDKQIEERKLKVKKSWKAVFHFNKNTKVKS